MNTPADRLAALRAVPGCGVTEAIDHGTMLPVAQIYREHRLAYDHPSCDACFTLLVDAVIANAVEGLREDDGFIDAARAAEDR